MTTLTLETADGRTAFEPGETIDATVGWSLVERPAAVELRLVWNTRGKGDTDVAVVQTERFDNPPSYESRRCTLELPEAPYSFSGKLISLLWGLELVVLPSNESRRLDITIGPDAREVVLPSEATAP
jgi:hypothetical protein